MTRRTYPQLIDNSDLDTWTEINEIELNCIFAESGADRELDFDREDEEEKLFNEQFANN